MNREKLSGPNQHCFPVDEGEQVDLHEMLGESRVQLTVGGGKEKTSLSLSQTTFRQIQKSSKNLFFFVHTLFSIFAVLYKPIVHNTVASQNT